MTRTMLGAAAIAFTLAAGAAQAADIPRGPVPYYTAPVPPAYSWAGPYLGFNVGYQWGSVSSSAADPSGFFGGLQAGYNWHYQQLVLGIETDIQASAAEDTFAAVKFSNTWFGTLRGRAGWALNNILLYGTVGFAYGGGRVSTLVAEESKTHTGYAAGVGIEVGFAPNWTARAEYLYVDLSNKSYTPVGAIGSFGFESSTLRLGANYRF